MTKNGKDAPNPSFLELLALVATGAPQVEVVAGAITDGPEGIVVSSVVRLRGIHVEEEA